MTDQEEENNLSALMQFAHSIKKDLASRHSDAVVAEAQINYHFSRQVRTVNTRIIISPNNYPSAKISLTEADWLVSELLYTEFQVGYQQFTFDPGTNLLIISMKNSPRLGAYTVEITELN